MRRTYPSCGLPATSCDPTWRVGRVADANRRVQGVARAWGLERAQDGELSLRRVLESTVDDVQVDGEWVSLTKNVTRGGSENAGG